MGEEGGRAWRERREETPARKFPHMRAFTMKKST
jgi:hypothetical protein